MVCGELECDSEAHTESTAVGAWCQQVEQGRAFEVEHAHLSFRFAAERKILSSEVAVTKCWLQPLC